MIKHAITNFFGTRFERDIREIQPIVEQYREYKTVVAEIGETQELTEGGDADMREMAEQELATRAARVVWLRDGKIVSDERNREVEAV